MSALIRDYEMYKALKTLENGGWQFDIQHNRVFLKYPPEIAKAMNKTSEKFFNSGCLTMEEAFSYIYATENFYNSTRK